MHELVGHAAEQPFAQTKMTVSSHDDDVGFSAFGFCDQRGSDVAVAAFDATKDSVDAVMP